LVALAFAADPVALTRYGLEHLFRAPFKVTDRGVVVTDAFDPATAPVPWGVFDGAGTLLDLETFAFRANDAGMLERALREGRRERTAYHVANVALTGALPAPGFGTAFPPGAKETWSKLTKHKQVADYYTAEAVDALLRTQNGELRRELGLTSEEAAALDGPPKR